MVASLGTSTIRGSPNWPAFQSCIPNEGLGSDAFSSYVNFNSQSFIAKGDVAVPRYQVSEDAEKPRREKVARSLLQLLAECTDEEANFPRSVA